VTDSKGKWKIFLEIEISNFISIYNNKLSKALYAAGENLF